MNKLSRSILIFCLVTVTVIASGCGAVTAVPSPTGTPVPTRMPTKTATATFFPTKVLIPTATKTPKPPILTPPPMFGWSIYFQHDFEANYWKPGQHSYRIIANCPDKSYLANYDGSSRFTIDENAPFYDPGVVVFVHERTLLFWDGYNLIRSIINPRNLTRISIGYRGLTFEQTTRAAKDCQARAIIDGELKVTLLPTEPDPIRYGMYPYVRP
jgi:hypothetical protein